LSALLLAVQIGPWYYEFGDADRYLSVARNLAQAHRLTCLGSPCLKYPPGYAAIVSPLFLIRERPFLELSILNWLLSVAFMMGVYVWARRVAPQAAVWIAALSVANNIFWIYHRRPASELAFVTVLVWTVNSLAWVMSARRGRSLAAGGAAALLLLALLCLIRPVGIAAAGGCGAAMLAAARRGMVSWRRTVAMSLLAAAVAVPAVAVVMLRERATAHATGEHTYLDVLAATQSGRLLRGPWLTISEIGRVTIPGMLKSYNRHRQWLDVNMFVYVPFFALLAAGWLRWVRRQADPFAWTLPCYATILTICAWDAGGRYWIPMIPALVTCAWFAAERLQDRRLPLLRAAWAAHVAAAAIYWLAIDLPATRQLNRQWPTVDAMAAQIPADSGPIAASESLKDLRIMLALTLDRRVARNADDAEVQRRAEWIVTAADAPPPAGFAEVSRSGGYCLFHRQAVADTRAGKAVLLDVDGTSPPPAGAQATVVLPAETGKQHSS
jgi:hypothetical protein